jgi:hypothetical protein
MAVKLLVVSEGSNTPIFTVNPAVEARFDGALVV